MGESIPRRSFVKRSLAASLLASDSLLFSGLVRASGENGGSSTTGPETTVDPYAYTTFGPDSTYPPDTTYPWETTTPSETTIPFTETTTPEYYTTTGHFKLRCDSDPKKGGTVTLPLKTTLPEPLGGVQVELYLEFMPSGPDKGDEAGSFDFQGRSIKATVTCKRSPFKTPILPIFPSNELDTSVAPSIVLAPSSAPTGTALSWTSGTHTRICDYDTGAISSVVAVATPTKTIIASYNIGDVTGMVVSVHWEILTTVAGDLVEIRTKKHVTLATSTTSVGTFALGYADATTAASMGGVTPLTGPSLKATWRTRKISVP